MLIILKIFAIIIISKVDHTDNILFAYTQRNGYPFLVKFARNMIITSRNMFKKKGVFSFLNVLKKGIYISKVCIYKGIHKKNVYVSFLND